MAKSIDKALVPIMQKLTSKDFGAKCLAQMQADHQKTVSTMAAHQVLPVLSSSAYRNRASSGYHKYPRCGSSK